MRSSAIALVFAFASLSIGYQAPAQMSYKVISIDVPGAAGTEGISINPAGVIVGQYVDGNGAYHGFTRAQNGAITGFDAPGAGTGAGAGEGTEPWSINAVGQVTGWYTDSAGVSHGFVRGASGSFNTFDAPGAAVPVGVPCTPPVICSNGTQAGSINAAGVISGQFVDSSDVFHGFVRTPDGSITTFDVPGAGMGPGQGTFLVFNDGISLSGAVVGGYGDANGFKDFIRTPDGAFTTFDPDGSTFPDTAGINSQGVTMGFYAGDSGSYHGFVRSADGDIASFDVTGAGSATGQGTEPENINTAGDITGNYVDGGGANHGFLRTKQGLITTFDAPGAGTGAGQGTIPFCNNTSNAITGFYVDADGRVHGFLRQ